MFCWKTRKGLISRCKVLGIVSMSVVFLLVSYSEAYALPSWVQQFIARNNSGPGSITAVSPKAAVTTTTTTFKNPIQSGRFTSIPTAPARSTSSSSVSRSTSSSSSPSGWVDPSLGYDPGYVPPSRPATTTTRTIVPTAPARTSSMPAAVQRFIASQPAQQPARSTTTTTWTPPSLSSSTQSWLNQATAGSGGTGVTYLPPLSSSSSSSSSPASQPGRGGNTGPMLSSVQTTSRPAPTTGSGSTSVPTAPANLSAMPAFARQSYVPPSSSISSRSSAPSYQTAAPSGSTPQPQPQPQPQPAASFSSSPSFIGYSTIQQSNSAAAQPPGSSSTQTTSAQNNLSTLQAKQQQAQAAAQQTATQRAAAAQARRTQLCQTQGCSVPQSLTAVVPKMSSGSASGQTPVAVAAGSNANAPATTPPPPAASSGLQSGISCTGMHNWGYIACVATKSMEYIPGLLTGTSYMLGTLLGAKSIVAVRYYVENPVMQVAELKNGIGMMGAGSALLAMPIIYEAMHNTVGSDGANVETARLVAVAFNVN
jgi:hypothetical protein